MTWPDIAATRLENEYVLLTPIEHGDRMPLRAIAHDPVIWRYFVSRVENDADFDTFFEATLADHRSGRRAVYVVTEKAGNRVAGSMSYGNMSEPDLRLEIGWSWLGADFRHQGINRRAKYLLLEHAFEAMAAERVEFKTDRLNQQARSALLDIGAVEEGTFRSYNPMPGNRRRDAVFYSIIRKDWPRVKSELRDSARTVGA